MAKFITNQNIEIQLELAGLGDRILAFLIDGAIIMAYAILVLGIIGISDDVLVAVILIPAMFYSLAFETLSNGQSPGKKIRNIKVVRLNGGSPTFANYLLRWLIRPVDIMMNGTVAIVTIILTKNGQRLGDLVAGTTVVKATRRVQFSDIKAVKKESHEVQFPQVRRLNDKQINLIRKALQTRRDGHNGEGVVELANKIKDILQITSDLPDVKFLYTLISDYEALTAE